MNGGFVETLKVTDEWRSGGETFRLVDRGAGPRELQIERGGSWVAESPQYVHGVLCARIEFLANVPLTRVGTPSRPASGSGMLLDCEGCWTHSIPIEDCDGDNCPLCGSTMLMEQGDQFDASVWGGGHNRTYEPNTEGQTRREKE